MEERESPNDNEGGFAGFGAVAFSAVMLNRLSGLPVGQITLLW
jgi:hypothetical protein